MNAEPDDAAWLRLAIEVGGAGGRSVRPNPRVGCVLVKDGKLVATGWHARCGGPHAEAVALAQAGENAAGSTAYVTLEPCDHWGRTPPCSHALVRAGVVRVVVGALDPHRDASGGVATLRAAGLAVTTGVEATAAADLAEVFFCNLLHKRSFLQLKLAMTLDGRTSAADGSSRWITGAAARAQVHALRAAADAVLIGSGTALADDPRLDVRDAPLAGGQPLRVVLDRRLRLPVSAHLADTSRQATLVYCDDAALAETARAEALRQQGVEIACLASAAGRDSGLPVTGRPDPWLALVLRDLYARGVCAVLCEGGHQLAGALLRAELCDRLDLILAPKLLGAGTPAFADLGIATLAEARDLRLEPPRLVGDDLWLTARPR